jgi:hypothetical protein
MMNKPVAVFFDGNAESGSIMAASAAFLRSLDLGDLASALPEASPDSDTGDGFSFRFGFPPLAVQTAAAQALVSKTAAAPLEELTEEQQYGEPYAPSAGDFQGMEHSNRPEGAYLLHLRTDGVAPETRGLTAPAVRKALASWAGTSLTALEYLVLQRVFATAYGDHRFDYYGSAADDTQWMWLPDSKLGDKTFMAYWNPKQSRVELTACRTGSKNPRKGAHPTRVVAV